MWPAILPPDDKKEINCTDGRFFLYFVILWIEKSVITFTCNISPKPPILIQEAGMNFYGIISYDIFHSHTQTYTEIPLPSHLHLA